MLRQLVLGVVAFGSAALAVWAWEGLNWDRDWTNSELIYRLQPVQDADGPPRMAALPSGWAPVFAQELSDTAVSRVQFFRGETVDQIDHGRNRINLLIADAEIGEVLALRCGVQTCGQALRAGLLVSEDYARRAFENSEPAGRTIHISGYGEYLVAGVVARPLFRTQLPFDIILPNPLTPAPWPTDGTLEVGGFELLSQYYLRRSAGQPRRDLERAINEIIARAQTSSGSYQRLELVKIANLHLSGARPDDLVEAGRPLLVYGALGMACLSLVVMIFDLFATAALGVARRDRDIGVLQAIGLSAHSIAIQISILTARNLVWLPIGFALAGIGYMVSISGAPISPGTLWAWAAAATATLCLPVLAFAFGYLCVRTSLNGSTPFIRLKGFGISAHTKRMEAAVAYVVLAISVSLVMSGVILATELHARSTRGLGFSTDQLYLGEVWEGEQAIANLRTILSAQGLGESVSTQSYYPLLNSLSENHVSIPQPFGPRTEISSAVHSVSDSFFDTMSINLLEFQDDWREAWNAGVGPDSRSEVPIIVNRAFLAEAQVAPDAAVGLLVEGVFFQGRIVNGRLVAVTGDFKFESLSPNLRPLILTPPGPDSAFVVVRANTGLSEPLMALNEAARRALGNGEFQFTSLASHVNDVAEPMEAGAKFLLFAGVLISALSMISIANMSLQRAEGYRLEFAVRLGYGEAMQRIVLRGLWIGAAQLLAIIGTLGVLASLVVLLNHSHLDLPPVEAIAVVLLCSASFVIAVLAPFGIQLHGLTRRAPHSMMASVE